MRTDIVNLAIFEFIMAIVIGGYLSLLLFLLFASCSSQALKFEVDDDSRAIQRRKGKEKFEEIRNTAEYGPCWKDALDELQSGCRSTSDHERRRLGLAFANCHFEGSGRPTYPCPKDSNIKDCTSKENMDDSSFQIYTQFFTHTMNMCYFLQSTLWQQKTESTINKLSEVSEEAMNKLEESLDYHKKLDKKQSLSLKNQEAILDQDNRIAQSLENTKSNMDAAFQDMYAKAESQKVILNDVLGTLQSGFGNIQWVLSSILGELITLETAGFFVTVLLLITFLPQFGTSRLWMFATLLLYGIFEGVLRRLFFFIIDSSTTPSAMSSLHALLWYSRWLSIIVLVFIFSWRYIVFTGHERRQESLLRDMNSQLNCIRQSLPSSSPYLNDVTEIDYQGPDEGVANNTLPLNEVYDHENRLGRIVSGTQLVDFLSGIYMKDNVQSFPEVEIYTTTDNTYEPPPTLMVTMDTSDSESEYSNTPGTYSQLLRPSLTNGTTNSANVTPQHMVGTQSQQSNNSCLYTSSHMSPTSETPPVTHASPAHSGTVRLPDTCNRESTPLISGRGQKNKRKRRLPVHSRHEYTDDDSGFSTSDCTNRSAYNLRPHRSTPRK